MGKMKKYTERELTPVLQARKAVYRELILQYYINAKSAKDFAVPLSFLSKHVLKSSNVGRVSVFFTKHEIAQIQSEALQIRREMYAPQLALIDEALIKAALKGNEKSIRLAYERFEGWSAKNITNFTGDIGTVVVIERTDGKVGADDNNGGGVNVTINRDNNIMVKKEEEEKPGLKAANAPPVKIPYRKKVKNVIPIDSKSKAKKPKWPKKSAPF